MSDLTSGNRTNRLRSGFHFGVEVRDNVLESRDGLLNRRDLDRSQPPTRPLRFCSATIKSRRCSLSWNQR